MTRVCFLSKNGELYGFEICGHAMTARAGKDILCAAISSAAYLTANTVTEVIGLNARAEAAEGRMKLIVEENVSRAGDTLRGFELHMEELSKQYPKNIELVYKEGAE